MLRYVTPTLILSAALVGPAHAGARSEELSSCMLEAATTAEKATLAQWVFSSTARHPAVSSLVALEPEKRTDVEKATAAMVERIIGTACRTQAQRAVQEEGGGAITDAFKRLGLTTAQQMLAEPAVASSTVEFSAHIDGHKMDAVLKAAK